MHKIALVLAIAAVGEGLLALHLVKQLHEEREGAQALQARVTELERRAPQRAAAATFVAVPAQPAISPFSVATRSAPAQAQAQLPQGVATTVPNAQDLREQMNAAMERQRTLLKDPEYREALQTQQKMMLRQQNPDVGRDLNLTPEQVDRLFGTLAEQALRSMDDVNAWESQPDPATATPETMQRKALEQQNANETELKTVLGEAKYREWMDYQTTAPARSEASRLRSLLADAGVPLDQSLAKPLQKVLLEHQKVEQQRIQQLYAKQNSAATTRLGFASNAVGLVSNTEEHMEEMQRRQREKLAHVLTPEQLKVIEDEQNAQLQLQRVQTKLMRSQAAAVTGDAAQNDPTVYFAPNATFEPAVDD